MYIDILEKNLLGVYKDDLIFQDDNDPKHRAKKVKKWLHDNNIKQLKWPSNSPDLNPIENLWGIFKNKLSKVYSNTVEEFESSIQKVWDNIDNNIINKLIKSMPDRIELVIENKGGPINY